MLNTNKTLDIFGTRFHNPSIYAIRANTGFSGVLTDFCVPANSYFPPAEVLNELQKNLPDILKYYPDYAPVHQENIAALVDIPAENIVAANGVTEIITLLCQEAATPIMTCVPTFGRWTDIPIQNGTPIHYIQRERERQFRLSVADIVTAVRSKQAQTLIISNPSNPTGAWLTHAEIATLVEALRDLALIVIDESFIEFADIQSADDIAMRSHNVMVVKSMGKAIGWHGVRLGYAVTDTRRAEALRNKIPYWNINGIAGLVLKSILPHKALYRDSFNLVRKDRDYMFDQLSAVPYLTTYPSQANFLFCELPVQISGKALRNRLLEEYGLVVRECSNKIGSSEFYLRFVVRTKKETDKLTHALHRLLPDMMRAQSMHTIAA